MIIISKIIILLHTTILFPICFYMRNKLFPYEKQTVSTVETIFIPINEWQKSYKLPAKGYGFTSQQSIRRQTYIVITKMSVFKQLFLCA